MDASMINLLSGEEYEDDVAIADMGGALWPGIHWPQLALPVPGLMSDLGIEGAVSNYEQDGSRSIGRRGRILPLR
jgi:hypothetical protein